MNPVDSLKLEQVPARAMQFFGRQRTAGEGAADGIESAGQDNAAPDAADIEPIAQRLLQMQQPGAEAFARQAAEGFAAKIVNDAQRALDTLRDNSRAILDQEAAVALEAVIHTRGRPAVRVLGNTWEDIRSHPNAERWALLADNCTALLRKTTAATAAVHVTDRYLGDAWVQGTAVLIKEDVALTNRHVLFPPLGTPIARRLSQNRTVMKSDYETVLDFAFDSGPARKLVYRITAVLYAAPTGDPVDAALLKVEPVAGEAPLPLNVSSAEGNLGRLYIVGHPGKMPDLPDDIRQVFGDPDEKKRISFGEQMDLVPAPEGELLHDASTIGGYSGAAVLGFAGSDLEALHYYGDSIVGNRAILAATLRSHPQLGGILR